MEPSQLSWVEYLQILGPILIGLLGVGIALYTTLVTQKNKRKDDERAEIIKKLNEFYSPFEQLRGKSSRLYRLFQSKKGKGISILVALLNEEGFSKNDTQLLKEIIAIDLQLEKLIIEKSGLVDKPEIRELLSDAITHFHLINAAFNGDIKGEADRFKSFVFPKGLDDKISKEINDLKTRLADLKKSKGFIFK